MSNYIDDVFGPGGLMANKFPKYQLRPGQIKLAHAVDKAMAQGTDLVAEAPCGSGKGQAYCVPATYYAKAGRPTLIVTASIALQEQLIDTDLKLLKDIVPWSFEPALIKGRNNYICRDKIDYHNVIKWHEALPAEFEDIKYALMAWAAITETGDRSEAPVETPNIVWSRISTSAEDCTYSDCQFAKECFAERAKLAARKANIIVTNYHMLFAHIAVRRATGKDVVLPPFSHVVCDEFHESSDIARDFFGFRVTRGSVARIARYLREYEPDLSRAIRKESLTFFDSLDKYAEVHPRGERLKRSGFIACDGIVDTLREAEKYITTNLVQYFDFDEPRMAEAANFQRRTQQLADRIEEAVDLTDSNKAYSIEFRKDDSTSIVAQMIDVGEILKTELFAKTRSVIGMSATLAVGSSFDYARKEFGVPDDADTLIVESPFDLYKQSMIVVPVNDGLVDPKDPAFIDVTVDIIQRVIDACQGRTLGLFTSWDSLEKVYDRIVGYNGYNIMRQGLASARTLRDTFKEDVSSVLLGTKTYWTGLDVPGEALTCVIIHKLPFAHFKDPVVDAIRDRYMEKSNDFFAKYYIPQATIAFRQGVGRLIRSSSDYGVVVVLDKRAVNRYRSFIVPGLGPKVSVGFSVNEIKPFLDARGNTP